MTTPILYYVADPMCSWCWGFAPTIAALHKQESDAFIFRYVMGGLARDSEELMPKETRAYVQSAWREVESRTGARFNWAFWETCQPRRSTYPACRAVLAAAAQNRGPAIFDRIQSAYYLEARNPSDIDTLVTLAESLDLDTERFAADLHSAAIEEALQADFHLRRKLQARSFPSLILESSGTCSWINRGWEETATVFARLEKALAPTPS